MRIARRTFVTQSIAILGATSIAAPVRRALGRPADDGFLAAVRAGDAPRVEALLRDDPGRLRTPDDAGRSPFAVALLADQPSMAALLERHGHAPDLHELALATDWPRFEAAAAEHPDAVNAAHAIGGSAMYCAARGGAGAQIWRVYAQGGRPNEQAPGGASPVRAALEHLDLATAEVTAATLLGNGADPNLPEPAGRTALHVAAERGSVELVEMLIRKHAGVEARDHDGALPIDRAEAAPVMELLRHHERIPRDHSTSRRAYDVDGRPYRAPDFADIPPHRRGRVVGQAHRQIDTVRAAVRDEPRLAHSVATTTEAAVEAGAHMGRVDIVDLLLEGGAPYALPTAVMRGDVNRVRALLAEDPLRIHERGAHDFALLWYPVIGGGNLELMELLLDAGAEIERQHHLGTTALHYAARASDVDMVRLLIERGSNVNRVGRKFGGQPLTPLGAARSDAVARVLRAAGAVGAVG